MSLPKLPKLVILITQISDFNVNWKAESQSQPLYNVMVIHGN